MSAQTSPSLRWGIVGCGLISSWFVSDMLLERAEQTTKHVLQAVGSSSVKKGQAFISKHAPTASPSPNVYPSYTQVYNDPDVDIVYIGTPHALHLTNALDAINAGKHVLCEKPMTINEREADILIAAAKKKGVFVMEALWTRFFPIASALQDLVHTKRVLGKLSRVFVDFGLDMPLASLPPSARTVDLSLGAGALLDIGIYTLTWASLILDSHPDNANSQSPSVVSTMSFVNGADEMSSVILNYESLGAQALCTSSMRSKTPDEFCRIEGEKGVILVGGVSASKPGFLVVKIKGEPEEKMDFDSLGFGFYYEADAVAADLRAGRTQSNIMPLEKTKHMMALMDKIRVQSGLRYKQDVECFEGPQNY